MFAFTGSDVYGRFQRLQGYDVFEPMGFDAFGIHSENYALKVGIHPAELIPRNIANFRRQLERIGGMFDWRHELSHHRSRVLQVDPVDLPPALQGGEGLQEEGGGQLVSQRQDRAGQRAGDRRPLRALRTRWSSGCWSSGSSGSPSTPSRLLANLDDPRTGRTPPAPPSATGSGGPRAPRSISRWRARRPSRSSPPGPTPSSAPPSWCWRRSTRWSTN